MAKFLFLEKKLKLFCNLFFGVIFLTNLFSNYVVFASQNLENDIWSEDTPIPLEGRENIFNWPQAEFNERVEEGLKHVFNYPVASTEMMLPLNMLADYFDGKNRNFVLRFFSQVLKSISRIIEWEDIERSLGLSPLSEELKIYSPYNDRLPKVRMGTSFVAHQGTTLHNYSDSQTLGVTFGCLACHGGSLFGKSVVGLANKAPRANDFFIAGDKVHG